MLLPRELLAPVDQLPIPHEPDDPPIADVIQPIMAEDNAQPAVAPANNQNMLAFNFRPQSFDGSKLEQANKWLRNFNRYADLAGVDDANRCTLLGLLLSGTAETWFNSLAEDVRTDWARLQPAFRTKFIDVEVTRMQRQLATLTRVQQVGETVDAYFTDARSKLEEHRFPAHFEITLLINGLRADVKGLVMQHQPFATVDALLHKARHIEASLRSNPVNPYVTPVAPVLANVTKEEMIVTCGDLEKMRQGLVEQIAKQVQELGLGQTSHQYVAPKAGPRQVRFAGDNNSCYTCGRTSHYARDCPYNRRSTVNRYPDSAPRYDGRQGQSSFRGRQQAPWRRGGMSSPRPFRGPPGSRPPMRNNSGN